MKTQTEARTEDSNAAPALGTNPLDREASSFEDPFLTALSAIEARRRAANDLGWPSEPGVAIPEAAEAGRPEAIQARRARAQRIRPISPLSEIPVPEPTDAFGRLTSDELRRRLSALTPIVDHSTGYDRHGLSLEALRRAAPLFETLYRHYFRVESHGHAHIPAEGPVVLVSNHAGLLPFDGAMIVMDLLMRLDPPRLARSVVDRFVGALPWANVFMARMGQVIGTRAAVRDLLADEQPVLVFPEGTTGILKPITQRHRIQPFHPGFVREALRAGAPVVPMAVIGSDDQSPILADWKALGRLVGMPGFPITPTFPWLGPLGLLPYPVRYRIVYGEPIDLGDAHRGGAIDDPRRLERLADRVRRRIQGLVNQHEGPAGGGA
jgi:1-acyl-sn-glycerol-3-phosphate acyltransferase